MEDVLVIYEQPYNPGLPVVCMDEKPYQCLGEPREPLPMWEGDDQKIVKWYTKTGHGGGRFWTGYMLRFNTVYIVHKHCSPIK